MQAYLILSTLLPYLRLRVSSLTMCIVALSAVGWAGRREAGNRMFWLQPQHACTLVVGTRISTSMEKTKALLLLHLISSCGVHRFLIDAPQSLPSVRSWKQQQSTKQVNQPAHIQTGGIGTYASRYKSGWQVAVLIKDGSLDCMCD